MININGIQYTGNSVSINGNSIIIDGKKVNGGDEKEININIEGNLDSLRFDYCNNLSIKGDVGEVDTGSGDVRVTGNIKGSVRTGSGDVSCKSISGNVKTGSGDVNYF